MEHGRNSDTYTVNCCTAHLDSTKVPKTQPYQTSKTINNQTVYQHYYVLVIGIDTAVHRLPDILIFHLFFSWQNTRLLQQHNATHRNAKLKSNVYPETSPSR